ncbi:MlaD family protein [Patulibacter sp. NPDC049589]|uniref:MlaD family protein n=1 Tax=Patulibacter sp. NPDC049589 TaxID=3154731 RepID=UPI003444CB22
MKTQNVGAKTFVLLLILLGGMAILAYFYSTAGGKLPLAEKPYKVTAILTEPQQVLKHADVRSAGVKVGEVGTIENISGNRTSFVLELKKKYAPVYRDAKILVRQKTLVGENYVDLTIGDAKSGQVPDGGTLAVAAQQESVPIDKVLNTLDPKTRKHVSQNLRAAGDSVKGRGQDLNDLFDRVAPIAEDGSQLLDILNEQRGQIARLVANTGVVMGAISSRTTDLQTLVRTAKATAEAVAARDQAVRTTFESIPPTLKQARTTVSRLTRFSGNATPVVTDLKTSLQSLKPVLNRLGPTATRARRLTDSLPALFKATNPTLASLTPFANDGAATVPTIENILREANPALAYLEPYHKEFGSFLANFGLHAATQDKNGILGVCGCPVSDRTLSNQTPEVRALLAPLLDQGPVKDFIHETTNHYRKPNSLPRADSEATPFGTTTSKFPHIGRDDTPDPPVPTTK